MVFGLRLGRCVGSPVDKWISITFQRLLCFFKSRKHGLVALLTTGAETIVLVDAYKERKAVLKILEESSIVATARIIVSGFVIRNVHAFRRPTDWGVAMATSIPRHPVRYAYCSLILVTCLAGIFADSFAESLSSPRQ